MVTGPEKVLSEGEAIVRVPEPFFVRPPVPVSWPLRVRLAGVLMVEGAVKLKGLLRVVGDSEVRVPPARVSWAAPVGLMLGPRMMLPAVWVMGLFIELLERRRVPAPVLVM